MTDIVRFRCNNCGHRFEAEVLDKNEQEEAQRKRRPTSPVQCPECKRTDIRNGWD
jgi:rubredoxin